MNSVEKAKVFKKRGKAQFKTLKQLLADGWTISASGSFIGKKFPKETVNDWDVNLERLSKNLGKTVNVSRLHDDYPQFVRIDEVGYYHSDMFKITSLEVKYGKY